MMQENELYLDIDQIEVLVRLAIQEDIGSGDVTSRLVVPPEARAHGVFVAKHDGVIAGLPVLPVVFSAIDCSLVFTPLVSDGTEVQVGMRLAEVTGSAASILSSERVSLNFLQRLSGIATLTRRYVNKVRGTRTKILDTRKTTPGWRQLEKYAVRVGGGTNHRMGLYDQVLIKDNHLELSGRQPITEAVRRAQAGRPEGVLIEVEAENIPQVEEALAAGADIIMLDNMPVEMMERAVKMIRSSSENPPRIEASGNVSLGTVLAIAQTGVDCISVGELTHSADSLDIALDLYPA